MPFSLSTMPNNYDLGETFKRQSSKARMMHFIVIGITDNPHPWFPPEIMEILKCGQVFSGGRRHHEIVGSLLPPDALWIDITTPLDEVFDHYRQVFDRGRKDIIVFASGDPFFFGFATTLQHRIPEAKLTVFPTLNSLQMLAHRLALPYHDLRTVSLTGRPWPEFDRALIERSPKLGILTDREHTPSAIAQRMLEYGYNHYTVHVGEHLGHPQLEQLSSLSLEEAVGHSFAFPNCVILTCSSPIPPRPFGLPDNSFALLHERQRMITKMPIRLLTLQVLDLPRRHTLWDIGFCTGSVSIEARLQFPHLRIEAFEIRPECKSIILENMHRHGAPGIGIHMGDFLTAPYDPIAATSQPDAVFIGGHGGHLLDIMAKVLLYLAPGGIIVLNSVSPQSKALFEEACSQLGLKQQPPLHIALNDYNPIDILSCKR